MKLLAKGYGSSLDILITFDLKIYYVHIEKYPNTWLLKQVYLLEEIPNIKDFKNRVEYYINHGGYHKLTDDKMDQYRKKIKQLMHTYINFLDPQYLLNSPDIYDGTAFHPDMIDLYQSL